jgi:hypothetical protein
MLAGIRSVYVSFNWIPRTQQLTKSHDGGSTGLLGDLGLLDVHDVHDNTVCQLHIPSSEISRSRFSGDFATIAWMNRDREV